MLQKWISYIEPTSKSIYLECQKHLDGIAKPVGSLGKLEAYLCQIGAASENPTIQIDKKCVLVFCADNGILAQGVAQSTHEVTTAIAKSLLAGTASVNVMANSCGAQVFPIDIGMIEQVDGMCDCRLGSGTGDFSMQPAMTREQAEQGICIGIELVKQRKQEGYQLIATGEAGIGNTTTSSAIASVLLGQPVEIVTGRGSGLTDKGLLRKQQAIIRGIKRHSPNPRDPIDVLAKVGGFDLVGMVGTFLGGAIYHIPVVMDGFISAVAALCAVRLCPDVKDYILPSHISAEPAGKLLMDALGFSPILHGDMRLGEGTGAVALFPLLDMAASVYHHAATFGDIKVEAYERWETSALS